MSRVQLSVEEYSSGHLDNDIDIHKLLESPLELQVECNPLSTNNVEDAYAYYLIDPQDSGIEKDELDVYLTATDSSRVTAIDDSDSLTLSDNIPTSSDISDYEATQMVSKHNHIVLSQSVGVTMPKALVNQTHKIQVVHDLELSHRPRYKSDYLAQNGTTRKPRYVSDQKGNHCVTLQVFPGIQGSIRVDWVTLLTETGIRYSMPYGFQEDNDSPHVSDSNPIDRKIGADGNGLIKLYLVLIKSKQDALRLLQPLQPFLPFRNTLTEWARNELENTSPLAPKTLIETYQLEKSQLAFTFCPLGPDGTPGIPEWGTTVYSTVLTETSTNTSKKRQITCPACTHSFELILNTADDVGHEKVVKKRKKLGE